MPILRVKEIREMSPEERRKKLSELRAELMRIKTMIKAGGSMENTSRARELRKAIARILTIENEEKKAKAKEQRKK
ncbi:50S ribosomal protein L29 [Candidatus Bathyarchaeota archaeon]|nr:MAG: 50S ribosomal protein L29 [Candidatus Bathyarchaeota archaeon]